MADLTASERQYLLTLAREVIAARLSKGEPSPRPDPLPAALAQNQGCFVTLHKQGMLRGCIGTLEPIRALIDAVAENAVNAAFCDPRFPPLRAEELDAVRLEISLLTVPEPLAFDGPQELISKLRPGVHGVILSKGGCRATFLPQVWEQLPDPSDFLAHLCQKAGLGRDCWQTSNIDVKVYEARYYSDPA